MEYSDLIAKMYQASLQSSEDVRKEHNIKTEKYRTERRLSYAKRYLSKAAEDLGLSQLKSLGSDEEIRYAERLREKFIERNAELIDDDFIDSLHHTAGADTALFWLSNKHKDNDALLDILSGQVSDDVRRREALYKELVELEAASNAQLNFGQSLRVGVLDRLPSEDVNEGLIKQINGNTETHDAAFWITLYSRGFKPVDQIAFATKARSYKEYMGNIDPPP